MGAVALTNYNGSTLKKTCVYDFGKHGGANGDTFTGFALPLNVKVIKAVVEVIKVPTSAASTATIAIELDSAGGTDIDIKTATVITNAFWATKGKKEVDLSSSAVTTDKNTFTFDIAVQDLTAGVIKTTVYYTIEG